MKIVKNPIIHVRTKHIEVHYHFIRKNVILGQMELAHVPTIDQLANILTKSLRTRLNYINLETSRSTRPKADLKFIFSIKGSVTNHIS
jgi:hypothetical protein